MNYNDARQRKSDGKWDYTIMNDGHVWPVGYCGGWKDLSPDSEKGKQCMMSEHEWSKIVAHKDKYHVDGHATKEEAYECYRQYMLDQRLRLDGGELGGTTHQACEACGALTQKLASVGEWDQFVLCDEHRTRENVDKLLKVGFSFGS